jgi:hypothetical protein
MIKLPRPPHAPSGDKIQSWEAYYIRLGDWLKVARAVNSYSHKKDGSYHSKLARLGLADNDEVVLDRDSQRRLRRKKKR